MRPLLLAIVIGAASARAGEPAPVASAAPADSAALDNALVTPERPFPRRNKPGVVIAVVVGAAAIVALGVGLGIGLGGGRDPSPSFGKLVLR